MVDSRLGRTEHAEIRRPGGQARWTPEPENREVGKPAAPLPLVHTERLEPAVNGIGECRRMTIRVVEGEHADAARLAVASHGESRRASGRSEVPERGDDRVHILGRTTSEERERDVEVRGRDDADIPDVGKYPDLPVHQRANGLSRQDESQEEARSVTTTDASSGRHAGS